jgi:hypothetical protein
MVSILERVAFLEGQSGEQIAATVALRVTVLQLGHDVSELRGAVAELRGSVGELRREMDRRLERLEDKFDRRLTWLVGTQVALLLAVVGALAAPYFQ